MESKVDDCDEIGILTMSKGFYQTAELNRSLQFCSQPVPWPLPRPASHVVLLRTDPLLSSKFLLLLEMTFICIKIFDSTFNIQIYNAYQSNVRKTNRQSHYWSCYSILKYDVNLKKIFVTCLASFELLYFKLLCHL